MPASTSFQQFFDSLSLDQRPLIRSCVVISLRCVVIPEPNVRVIALGDGYYRVAPQLPVIDVEDEASP